MNVALQAGLTVVAEQGQLVFGILVVVALAAGLAQRLLRLTGAFDESIVTGLSSWLVILILLALLWLWIGLIPVLLLFILGLMLTLRFKLQLQPVPIHEAVSLLMLVTLSLLIRLAFIKDLLLPSYFDSAQHYLLIRNLVEPSADLPVSAVYYHQGFHWVVAFLVSLFHAKIGITMLVFGQVLLALIPTAIYGFVRQVTNSHSAGLLTFMLAGLGWYMPAHAVNWGKYPALTSIALLPFVIWLLYRTAAVKNKWLYVYTAAGILMITLVHSRSLIALSLLVVAWVLLRGWEHLKTPWRILVAFFGVVWLAWELFYTPHPALLRATLDPYLEDGLWVTWAVLGLAIPAWRRYTRLTGTLWLSAGLWLGAVFIPVPVPGYGTLTLLDRPYVEMLLFIPLAITGGLGMGELLRVLKPAWGEWSVGVFVTSLSVFIAWAAFQSHNFRASACCILVGRDDLAAITWLDEQLPENAVIGVAASVMDVLPAETFEGYNGSDAGIWILPLTGRPIIPVPNTADLADQTLLASLCHMHITHLYLGSQGQTFNPAAVQLHKLVLTVGRAGVYELQGCP